MDKTKEEERREYQRVYRLKNAERIKAQRKKYEEENKERIKQLAKASRIKRIAENPEKVKAQNKARKARCETKNPERYAELRREYIRNAGRRRTTEIRDNYVAYLLSISSGSRLYSTDIPKELIEAKRLQLMIKRELENEKRK